MKMKRWRVGLVYWPSQEPFEWVVIEASDKQSAIGRALRFISPNPIQLLTVQEEA